MNIVNFNHLRVVAAFLTLLMAGAAIAQSGSKVLVTVNGSKVTAKQLDDAVSFAVSNGAQDTPELRQNLANDLIWQEAVMQDAKKTGLTNQSGNEFKIRMAQQTAIIDIWFSQYFKDHPLTEERVKEQYDKELKLAAEPKNANQYLTSQIVLGSEADANGVIALINSGSSFSEIAKERSLDKAAGQRGGVINWALPGQFPPPVADAILTLNKGQITLHPLQTPYGWFIVKVDDIRPFKLPPFDDIKNNIAQSMIQNEKQQAVTELMKTVKVVPVK